MKSLILALGLFAVSSYSTVNWENDHGQMEFVNHNGQETIVVRMECHMEPNHDILTNIHVLGQYKGTIQVGTNFYKLGE